jgi:hypothetical protein
MRSLNSVKTGDNEEVSVDEVQLSDYDISSLKTMVIICDAPGSLLRQISPNTAKL